MKPLCRIAAVSHLASSLLLVLFLATGAATPARGAAPRVFAEGTLPNDQRLGPLKDLNGYFPFAPPASPDAWSQRAQRVRRQVLVAAGLWPMPEETPLRPVIHGRIEREGYTVEKVFFESVPGFFVTGNLYRPTRASGKRPGILSAHGHWPNGRFNENEKVRDDIAQGGERFESGRSFLQARCVQLARMGCVVFHYDMIGYGDNQQVPFAVAHQEDAVLHRPEMNQPEAWGLFSAPAESRLQSVLGLQTWNSIRALDFLASLPDVDAQRLGVTGESGGGTQTFLLCAVDPRPTAAFPAVMVSTGMQGGCTCENAPLLRVDTGNVEIAALFAPKPLGMTAANDWTREMPAKGFPELKRLFTTLGAPDHVQLTALTQFKHNYNYPSRAAMYAWFNRHLSLGQTEPVVEADFHPLTRAGLTVWDERHPQPPGGPEFERALLRRLAENTTAQLRAAPPERYRGIVVPAIDVLIGRTLAEAGAVEFVERAKTDGGGHAQILGLLRNRTYGEELPVVILQPGKPNGETVIWLEGAGKAALFETGGDTPARARPEVQQLLAGGTTVIGADLLYQGEFLRDGQPLGKTRRVKDSPIAAYTFGYNRALFAQRVHDILSVVQFAKRDSPRGRAVSLVGLGGAGPITAAARALCGPALARAAIATDGFRFANVLDLQDENFLPGGAKYDDLPGLLALGSPGKLWLGGEPHTPELVKLAYQRDRATDRLTTFAGDSARTRDAVVSWLLPRD